MMPNFLVFAPFLSLLIWVPFVVWIKREERAFYHVPDTLPEDWT